MIVEFALTTEENEEPSVMEKVLELTKHITQVGFKIDNVVGKTIVEMKWIVVTNLRHCYKGAATAAGVTLMIK